MNWKLIVFIPLLFSSCMGVYKTYTFETPAENVAYWNQGTAFQSQTIDSVTVELGYIKRMEHSYVFSITVSNGSEQAVYFDPSILYAHLYKNDSLLIDLVGAINPENKLQELDTRIKQEKARITRNAVFSVLGSVAGLAADVAIKDTEENTDKKEALRSANETLGAIHAHNISDAEVKLMNLYDWVPYWQESVIRKTTIFPEHYHRGDLHFNLNYAPLVKITVPVGERLFKFTFLMKKMVPQVY
ncbi:MAG: hypothetical protein AB7E36_13815 [Salinivirgaceae bacterium]